MYAIYRELNPPTGVEHCIECNFFSSKQKSLVVAAASVLRVYNLRKRVRIEISLSLRASVFLWHWLYWEVGS